MFSKKWMGSAAIICALVLQAGCKLDLNTGISLQSRIEVTNDGEGTTTIDHQQGTCDASGTSQCYITGFRQTVKLTPHANPGYEFAGWTGDCIGLGYCNLYTSKEAHVGEGAGSHSVTARFVPTGTLSLTNHSADLNEVLEYGQTKGSCDRYFDNIADPAIATDYLKMMCGKYMFFYEGFDLLGVPAPMVDMLIDGAPNSVGDGFEAFGMIADPYSSKGYPLGLAAGKTIDGAQTLAFGCASCHFGKAGDIYSVGQANHDYEYGKQIMTMTFAPLEALGAQSFIEAEVAPEVKSYVAPQVAELKSNLSIVDMLFRVAPLAPLLSNAGGLPIPSADAQRNYLSWEKGTQDFVIDPVGLEDGVHTVSKIAQLWGLAEMDATGDARLGFTGATPSVDIFIQDFIVLSLGSDKYTAERREPLRDFLLTLQAPANPTPPNAGDVATGQALFTTKGCDSCHHGPHGSSGTQLFTYAEIGTDEAMREWADKDADGVSEVPELFQNGSRITHQLKAPKMAGLWAQKRFLHNGSVESLEALFCLPPHGMRPTITEAVFSDKGHMMTCTADATNPTGTLTDTEKQQLIAYLRSL